MTSTGKLIRGLLGLLAIAGGRLVASDVSSANPYVGIAERNAFGLRAPRSPQPPAAANLPTSNAAPGLSLTGIADFSAKNWALLTSAESGKPKRHYTMAEGEAQDGLEVLEVDGVSGTVRIRYRGAELALALVAPDNSRREAQVAEKQAAEERARGDEVLQARERARLDFERTLAAAAGTDSATGQPISNSGRSHITFAPDGNLVISSDGSDSVRVWDAATANFRPANPR